jgi:hypothetical protein
MYRNFWSETLNGISHLEDLFIDDRILGWILEKSWGAGSGCELDASGSG